MINTISLFATRGIWIRSTFVLVAAALMTTSGIGQNSPTSETPATDERFEISVSTEIGARNVSVDGNREKFRSDLNYRNGFRVFDSSIVVEDKGKGYKVFDSALIISSGWGADPSGFLRINMERTGKYRLDTNVRRVSFYNNLNNHALSQHDADSRRTLGDIDLIVFPESPDFRMRFGYSLNTVRGTGGYTTRAYSDEFPVVSFVSTEAHDLRAGIDGKLLGFNLTGTYGYRNFDDHTRFTQFGLNLGNNPTNNPRLFTFDRQNPVLGETHFGIFTAQRTFAKKLDMTVRISYSDSRTNFTLFEALTGRDNSNNQIDLDRFEIRGDSKRPQTRADLGLTYMVTDKFRISNTFTFDQFNITGGNLFAEAVYSRTSAGAPRPTTFTNTLSHRLTSYKRYVNTVEADYQANSMFGFNIGYRYTHRQSVLELFDRNFASATPTTEVDEFSNSTHTFLAGTKIKPMKNWAIFADVERGRADNVFTRLANYRFTNFRVRSRWSFNKVAANLSAIVKNNTNPAQSIEVPPRDFGADVRNRTYSGSLDWDPIPEFSLSGGYTYTYIKSESAIIVPVSGQRLQGISEFYMRDHYAFVDVTARPIKRITLFGSYRFSNDQGQKDLVSTLPQNIITSYPMTFKMPEFRMSVMLSRYIDWNIGYQYFGYTEKFQNTQDYNAHLPYMSLRIYLGRGADR